MTTMKGMTSKLLIFLTTCVFVLVHADVGGRETAESYITKEAAKELRNKLSHIKNDGNAEEQQDDYDEILKEIIHSIQIQGSKEQPQKHPQIFYEKKYFDYLPNDISDSDDASEDLSHELGKKNNEYSSFEDEQHMAINVDDDEKEKHKNGKRIVKRDVTQQNDDNKARVKRQNFYYVPLNHYNPYPRFHFYYPSQDPFFTDIFNHLASESRQQSFPVAPPPSPQFQQGNNPWIPQNNPNLRLHQPYNFYLPAVSPPSPTYLPVGPTNRPPHNIPSPPDNQANRPSGTSNDEFDDRISGFESPDDRPIWGAQNIIPKGESGSKVQEKPFQTTQRPYTQNQPRPSQNEIPVDDIFYTPNEKPEVELEFAPELQEDVTSTTRASIRRPTKKRQKKEDLRTTTQPPSTTLRRMDNINSLYSQQVMTKKPLAACVQAIVNCCSKYDDVVRLPCFEAHNCNGAFIGRSVCSRDVKQSAFKEIEKYTE
ncbi:uncharacterized protein hdly isoform X2 [Chironomus tepperi]|uniref:uncharacterized protein hdly isoform X2 n=1 Tax=Chironomus tepperi TaxID=113505 RepID=UPI00391F7524